MGRYTTLIVAIVLTAFVVGATMYAYFGGQLTELEMKYKSLQRAMAEKPSAITPASIKFNQTGGTVFNFTDAVAADGSVSTTTTKELAFDISNEDTKTATVKIMLINPKTGEKGLPEALQNAYVKMFVRVGAKTYTLYADNKFGSGYECTLEPGVSLSGSIGVTLIGGAPAGTFSDNQTYTIKIYIVQPDAGSYTETYSYTLKT